VAAAHRAGEPSLEVSGADEGGGPVVHVAGAVRRPGVYRLRAGARVADAVRRAGGARRRADLGAVNLAAELQDGRQVLVPPRAKAGAPAHAGAAPAPGVPLDLNTATLEQLDELDGIGPATAQQIVSYREAHGGFGSVEELDQVPGIGETRLAALRDKVRV
jgi:competence protein ComEA